MGSATDVDDNGADDVLLVLDLKLLELEDAATSLYRLKPLGPPQIVEEFPAQVMEHRWSVAVTDPVFNVFPQ